MKVRPRTVLEWGADLTINPFVSVAQQRACWAGAMPGVDCQEWQDKTVRKLPKKKRPKLTANAKRGSSGRGLLRADPTRTLTMRRAFLAKIKRKFALLKGAIVRKVVVEDALGLRNPTHNAFCPTGEGGGVDASCSPSGSKVGEAYKATMARVSSVIDRAPGGKFLREKAVKLKDRLVQRYGAKQAAAIIASGQAISWGAFGAGIALGTPIWIPSAAATLPGVVLAELHHRMTLGKTPTANVHDYSLASTDLVVSSEEPRELTQDEVDELGRQLVEELERKLDNPTDNASYFAECARDEHGWCEPGTGEVVHVGGDIKAAAKALARGARVTLDQPDQLATLLDKMYAMVQKAVEKGKDAPKFDLCKVSVAGSNLFCQENIGVPRVQMPQMRGLPVPGSLADRQPKNAEGRVDVGKLFVEHLKSQGVKVEQVDVRASHLRASQNEIDGARVADLVATRSADDLRKRPIFVTRDNYVVDGHHHWAALVGKGAAKDKDFKVPVYRLDTDIGTALHMANAFAKEAGIKPKSTPTANELLGNLSAADVDAAAAEAHPEPTEAQKRASNYRMGHVTVQGLPITVETARGSTRRGITKDGKEWSVEMRSHYGYVKRTESEADGDHVDVFLGPDPSSEVVFVIDQNNKEGEFDEAKCMVGWHNAADAKQAYLDSYSAGWTGFRSIRALTMPQFKRWLAEGDTGRPIAGQLIATTNAERFFKPENYDKVADLPDGKQLWAGGNDWECGWTWAWIVDGSNRDVMPDRWLKVDHSKCPFCKGDPDAVYSSRKGTRGCQDWAKRQVAEWAGVNLTTNAPEDWRFHTDPAKVKAFQEWLRSQIQANLTGRTDRELWQAYIEAGFRKGAGRAFSDVNQARDNSEKELDFYAGTKDQFLRSSFRRPETVEKVQLLAGRTFDELENVTADMSNKISRALTDGLVEGKNPRDIADDMVDAVDIGYKRAEVISRTELTRAHSEGQLTAFEQMGVTELGVAVEWTTSKLDRVDKRGNIVSPCEACAPMDGAVFKLDEARGMIPAHPNCLCCWTPANVGEDQEGQSRSKPELEEAIRISRDASKLDEDEWGPAKWISKERPESILNQLYHDALPELTADQWGQVLQPLANVLNRFCPTGEGGGVDPTCGTEAKGGDNPRVHTPEFKAWFKGSKVVDDKGDPKDTTPARIEGDIKPVVVYHGTGHGEFDEFREDKITNPDELYYGKGFYFTEDLKAAHDFAVSQHSGSSKPTVMSMWLKVERPFDADTDRIDPRHLPAAERAALRSQVVQKAFSEDGRDEAIEAGRDFDAGRRTFGYVEMTKGFGVSRSTVRSVLEGQGHDGIKTGGAGERFWIVFKPTQIKATNNKGTFDPASPNIRNAFDPDQPRDEHGRFTSGGEGHEDSWSVPLVGAVPVSPQPVTAHIAESVHHDAAQLVPAEVAKLIQDSHGWEVSEPWNKTKEQINSGEVPGVDVATYGYGSTETAHYESARGLIHLAPKFFSEEYNKPGWEDVRKGVMYHELGHALSDSMLKDLTAYQLLDADVMPGGRHAKFDTLNGQVTPGEVIAEAYSVLHTEPSFLQKNFPGLVKPVLDRAKAMKMPLPKGIVANAEPVMLNWNPAQDRDDDGRFASQGLKVGGTAKIKTPHGLPLYDVEGGMHLPGTEVTVEHVDPYHRVEGVHRVQDVTVRTAKGVKLRAFAHELVGNATDLGDLEHLLANFNPNHDERGRFSSGEGGEGSTQATAWSRARRSCRRPPAPPTSPTCTRTTTGTA